MAGPSGSVPSIPGIEEMIRRAVSNALGDPNLKVGGVTFGKVQHGEQAGKLGAVYSTIKIKSGTTEYEVPHSLGRVPGFCILWGSENRQSPGSIYAISWLRRDEWTATTCRVNVALQGAGSMDGGELTFLVGGER